MPFIAIIIALTISILTGCVDREKQILEKNNYDISMRNARLVEIINDQEQKIKRYQSGLDEKREKERQFSEQLSVAVTCDSMPYLINICPASLKEARQKTLEEANKKGISVLTGHQYWMGLFMSVLLTIMISFVIFWVWILMVQPTKKDLAESRKKIADEQSHIDKIRQTFDEKKGELSALLEKIKSLERQIKSLEMNRSRSENDAIAARKVYEAAQAEAEKMQKKLDLLKGFKK